VILLSSVGFSLVKSRITRLKLDRDRSIP